MIMPEADVREPLLERLYARGLQKQLGQNLFPPDLWHQSLSGRFFSDSPAAIKRLLAVGDQSSAPPFNLTLDRIAGGEGPPFHWAFRAARRPLQLSRLIESIRKALLAQGGHDDAQPSAHITISYRAPGPLPPTPIPAVHWTVWEFLLVRGGGTPYRYEVLGRWPLRPDAVSPQRSLFEEI